MELPRAIRHATFLERQSVPDKVYWIEAYKQQQPAQRHRARPHYRLEMANVASDRFFDAITVRLYATGLDYTITEDGSRVVTGSRSKERCTRSIGRSFAARPALRQHTDKSCPSCGAPLQINMAGNCEYCKAKVTSGEFDWVLSKIEQDESYEG